MRSVTPKQHTHERLSTIEALSPGSDRAFGLVMTTVFALLAGFSAWHAGAWWPWLTVIALLFLASAWLRPGLLAPLNKAWFRFGLLLHAVINPLVMGLLFFCAVTPTGWIIRLRGKDLLRLKRMPQVDSYWIARRPPGPAPQTMKDQF